MDFPRFRAWLRDCLRSVERRDWLAGLGGAAAAAFVFAVFVLLRAGWQGLGQTWDLILLVALLSGAAIVVAFAAAHLRQRQAMQRLANQLTEFRHKPSHVIEEVVARPETSEELRPLVEPIESLCTAYRKILKDRVELGEALTSLKEMLHSTERRSARRMKVSQRTSGSSRNMVGRLTVNLRWMTATPALQHFLHTSMPELNGRPLLERVHPDDAVSVVTAFEQIAHQGKGAPLTFRLLPIHHSADTQKNGKAAVEAPCHVRLEIQPRRSADQVYFRCFFTDVTELRTAEAELQHRTAELRQVNDARRALSTDLERLKQSYYDLYQNAPVMFFSLDPQGQFVSCNDTMLKALGYQRDDLSRQPYSRLLPPASRPAWEQNAGAAAGKGLHLLAREGEVECQWIKNDGSVIDVWIRTVPIRDEQGQFARSRSAALDVTLRNRLAAELRRHGDELERANAQLRRTNRELEEFGSVVSHDLREPLRTIQAYSSSLAQDFGAQLGPDGFESINHLLQASRRLEHLIHDLLTLSGAGRTTRALEAFDFIEIVATVRRDLADLIQRKGAEVLTVGHLPTVVGDPQRITQLLSNLVANALKYNRGPVPRVTIGVAGAETVDTPSGFVTLGVRDNGIGIPREYHEQIFGLFRRLHPSEEYEGTGAGLAICKKIVQAHGGRIWVESRPGEGSTFLFTLPTPPAFRSQSIPAQSVGAESVRAEPAWTEPAEAVAENGKPGPEKLPARKTALAPAGPAPKGARSDSLAVPGVPSRRILLVEDIPEIAAITQRLSRRAGHQIIWLSSAEQAWDFLCKDRPDLILLDIHLPGMSGLELCAKVRGEAGLKDLRIAFFTQSERPEDLDRNQAAGADYILTKDLLAQPNDWLRRLDEILQGVHV